MDAAVNTLAYEQPTYIESGVSNRPTHPANFGSQRGQQQRVLMPDASGVTNNYTLLEPGSKFGPHYIVLDDIGTNQSLWPEGAPQPMASAISAARAILGVLEINALVPTRVVATAEGGVAICFVQGDKYSDIECFNSGTILGVVSGSKKPPLVWEIEPGSRNAARAAEQIRAFLRA